MQPPRQHEVRLVITRILRPLPRPTARRAAVPAPPVLLRFTAARLAAHPPPRRGSAPRPPASCDSRLNQTLFPLAASSAFSITSGVRHTMPPAPQDSRSDAARKRFGNVVRVVHIGGSRGHLRALRRQVLSSSFPALPRSCLTCAAWSFLRDHLTPRPAVAKSTYRFCVRKIRHSPALQNYGNHRSGGVTAILGCRAKSAGQAWFGP